MTKRVLSACLVVLFLSGASVEQIDTSIEISDAERLQGTWELVSKEFISGGWNPCDVKVKGDTIHGLLSWGEKEAHKFSYKLKPANGEITFTTTLQDRTLSYEGIYKIDGDRLTICLKRDLRPTRFATDAPPGALLMTLQRKR